MQIVTAAIIVQDGSVLLARRGPGDPLAGKWEFPGGKLEDGETPEACLARELHEELGVRASIGELFAESAFDHGSGQLRLLAYRATITTGTPTLSVHSELAWVDPRSLPLFDLLPADVPIAQKLADHHATV
jgi:8-oxo-dGTP diphosphatase